jgi:hypothetical protein
MGILEFVRNEHAGLIPRAIAQIFDYVDNNEGRIDMTISLSFLQLYRETIQDLLTQANGNASSGDENLLIREDPVKGFYVDGLQEFVVRSYLEAEALINLGLENRAIAPTMMNSTSSRSHTVLTINIEQRVQGDQQNYTKTLRSKLLMVDLAGSERVRRTVSKGTRLSEAKSINTSLSALGNVIAALAESNSSHIPYRDSKLTRLLQDSLGGTAATALIATIGPAAINYGETLSTLLFAQRCMAVKVTPIPHEEVDYAEMCAKLQAQLNDFQGSMSEKLIEQQAHFEKTIIELQNQLEDERHKSQQSALVSSMGLAGGVMSLDAQQGIFQDELRVMMDAIERLRDQDPVVTEVIENSWFMKPSDWSAVENDYDRLPNGPLVSVLAFSYEILRSVYLQIRQMLRENQHRDDLGRSEMAQLLTTEESLQQDRHWERNHMAMHDPRNLDAQQKGRSKADPIGSHLSTIQRYDAMKKIDLQFQSNNYPVSSYDRVPALVSSNPEEDEMQDPVIKLFRERPTIFQYENLDHFLESLTFLHQRLSQDLLALNVLMARKDVHFKSLKEELTTQVVDRRKREEEVVNWSYILKYLLKSTSKLRKELQTEKRVNAHPFPHHNVQATPAARIPFSEASTSSGTSRSTDPSATPDTVNFLTNFLRHNPTSAGSLNINRSMTGDMNSLGEDSFSESSETMGSGRGRSATFDSNLSSMQSTPVERPMSMSHQPFRDGGSSANNDKSNKMLHQVQFATEEEQDAYDDAFQRVQLRGAKPNTAGNSTFIRSFADREDDSASDYSSLPSTSAQSYQSATPSSSLASGFQASANAHQSTNNNNNRKNASVNSAPIVTASSVVTGKDGRPVIVTSSPHKASTGYNRSDSSTSNSSSSSNHNHNDFQPIDISKRGNNQDQAVGRALAKNRAKKEMAQGPSSFAQDVAKSLGVQGQQARDAMAIIDQIAGISPEQLQQLDAATRQEILQLRQELGIDKFLRQEQLKAQSQPSSTALPNVQQQEFQDDQWHQRASAAEQNHIDRARAFAPSSSGTQGSNSRSSSRTRTRSTLRNDEEASPVTATTPSGGGQGFVGSNNNSRSSSRSNSRTRNTAASNSVVQPEIRSSSSTGSKTTVSNPSTSNKKNYLQQHSVQHTPVHSSTTPAAFVDLAAMMMRPSSTTPAATPGMNSTRSRSDTRNSHSTSSETTGRGYPRYQEEYDDEGYYSGVADSSISSRNSFFMQGAPPPPPPPPRPAHLGGGTPASSSEVPSAMQSRHARHAHRPNAEYAAGYASISSKNSDPYDEEDNDDEFSQLDSMG